MVGYQAARGKSIDRNPKRQRGLLLWGEIDDSLSSLTRRVTDFNGRLAATLLNGTKLLAAGAQQNGFLEIPSKIDRGSANRTFGIFEKSLSFLI